jgi:hypothetical protein
MIFLTKLDDFIKRTVASEMWMIYVQPPHKKCPNCEMLESFFEINNIKFERIDIYTPEAASEMGFRYVFPIYTPVLQKGLKVYYKQLWSEHGKKLNFSAIKDIIDPYREDWIDIENEKECKDGVCEI